MFALFGIVVLVLGIYNLTCLVKAVKNNTIYYDNF